MSMFDVVKIKSINRNDFKHNGNTFQTKDLSLNLSDYEIVNDKLLLKVDGGKYPRLNVEEDVKYDGTLDIYTYIEIGGVERRVEYRLTFKDGLLDDVEMPTDATRKDTANL